MKKYKRLDAARALYAFAYTTGDKALCDKITANSKRVQRIVRIMRDPFYLQAERAAAAALKENENE